MEQSKVLIKNLTYLMRMKNVTQKQVAEAIGVPPTTFNTWMRGKALPRMGKIAMLASYFNVPVSEIVTDKQEELTFTLEEIEIIRAYRKADEIDQRSVCRILNIQK